MCWYSGSKYYGLSCVFQQLELSAGLCVDLNRQTGKMEMPVSPQQGRELLRARCFLKHGKARLNDESDMLNARSRGQFHLETTGGPVADYSEVLTNWFRCDGIYLPRRTW